MTTRYRLTEAMTTWTSLRTCQTSRLVIQQEVSQDGSRLMLAIKASLSSAMARM